MNQETIILHWIYVGVMLLGSLIIAIMSKNPKRVPKIDYLISFFIPVWSALCYMSIAIQQGIVTVDNQTTFFARYLDWIVTTPLLLVALSFTAMYYAKKDKALILGIVGADIIMITCGFVGDMSTGNYRLVWFFIGLIAFFVVLWLIWGPLENIASTQGANLYSLYKRLALYLTVFWIGYPLTWILGPSGLAIVGQRVDTYLFIILPIFSKVGFGLLDITGLRKLEENSI